MSVWFWAKDATHRGLPRAVVNLNASGRVLGTGAQFEGHRRGIGLIQLASGSEVSFLAHKDACRG